MLTEVPVPKELLELAKKEGTGVLMLSSFFLFLLFLLTVSSLFLVELHLTGPLSTYFSLLFCCLCPVPLPHNK